MQIYYGNDQPWDDHKDIANHRVHASKSDRPIAALLHDLKARGLLGRHAGPVGRRVRPYADERGGEGPRPSQPWLHACGSPAAE